MFLFLSSQVHLASSNVTDRGLVTRNPRTKDIIKFHSAYHKNVSDRNFAGDVLVYVTPVSWRENCFHVVYEILRRQSMKVWMQLQWLKVVTSLYMSVTILLLMGTTQ